MLKSVVIYLIAAILLVWCLSMAASAFAAPKRLPVAIASPNHTIQLTFGLKKFLPSSPDVRPYYHVNYRGKTLVEDSPLGIEIADAPPLDRNFQVRGITRQSLRHDWQPVVGKSQLVQERGEQLTVALQERRAPHRQLNIIFRADDDGIALRYEWLPQPHLKRFQITAEKTEFRFPANYTVWALPPGYHTYESEYRKQYLDNLPSDNLQALPLLISAGDSWLALMEADLTHYAGMYVSRHPDLSHTLLTRLPNHRHQPAIKVETQTPGRSPWRVLAIAPTPGALIQSHLLLNLSRPSAIADTSWIKPGKATWNWWSGSVVDDPSFLAAGNQPGMNTATMKHYIDFAAQMGFEYSLIDAGWYEGQEPPYDNGDITKPISAIKMDEIVNYAEAKGVKVILWIHSRLADRQMHQAFPLYEQWGIAGVKIDFMDSDDQPMVEFYERALQQAAKHHLVVNFHGAFKPTGLNRTFPNELTREGVLGLEAAKWSKAPDPEHNVTLPFTRMLAGPMDYTPGGFTNINPYKDYTPSFTRPAVLGTRCHQLAMYVVYQSGLAMVSDFPENILGQEGANFLRQVPTAWDETRVVNGEPGDYITIARQQGKEWYLGAMTDWTPRSLSLPLSFLGAGRYTAEIYADDPKGSSNPEKVAFHKSTVTAKDTLTARLASGGGFAVRFYPTE